MDSKVLIRLPRKQYVEELGREISLGEFEKHVITRTDQSYSDKKHTITPESLQQEPHRFIIKKDEYLLLEADFLDEYKQLKRLAQIITLKDLGRIITLLGVTKDSVVVEAGTGSGAATCYLAKVAREVHSYEVNEEHLTVARENTERLGISNVQFHKTDVYEGMKDHGADAFLLDVPDPARALPQVIKALRMGGRCVVYTPNLTQARDVANSLPDALLYEGVIELTERGWQVQGRQLRPRMQGLGHTSFLTLLRKIPGGASR
ncbi:methyltransferase domain-containing protein [Candidatus Woesearchaeota archaeon]|nr:methyltransferase domain-containing protein [Candidatus Woesearchaeota archaeon]